MRQALHSHSLSFCYWTTEVGHNYQKLNSLLLDVNDHLKVNNYYILCCIHNQFWQVKLKCHWCYQLQHHIRSATGSKTLDICKQHILNMKGGKTSYKFMSFKSRITHLNTSILIKTTASNPPIANITSSDVSQAFKIQLGEGTNLSNQWGSSRVVRICANLRPKYTFLLLGCFLNTEYNEKSTQQTPILIPAEVKRADISILIH